VAKAHIVDGRLAHSVLLEIFTDGGSAPRSYRIRCQAPASSPLFEETERSRAMKPTDYTHLMNTYAPAQWNW